MSELESPEQKGRILVHDEGLGVPSRHSVEARAGELAVIAGRPARGYTDTDFAQAKRELSTGGLPADDVEQALAEAPSLSEVPGTRGHQVPNYGGDDESSIGQELVEEGMEEGLHDEMVEGSRKSLRDDS